MGQSPTGFHKGRLGYQSHAAHRFIDRCVIGHRRRIVYCDKTPSFPLSGFFDPLFAKRFRQLVSQGAVIPETLPGSMILAFQQPAMDQRSTLMKKSPDAVEERDYCRRL